VGEGRKLAIRKRDAGNLNENENEPQSRVVLLEQLDQWEMPQRLFDRISP